MTPHTVMRLRRAAVGACIALVAIVLAKKIGYEGAYSHLGTPDSWAKIVQHLDRYLLISVVFGIGVFLWPWHKQS